jgi:hypothetical protein
VTAAGARSGSGPVAARWQFNISEVLPVPGAALAGALPPELQSYITFVRALHVDSAAPDAAGAYLKKLAGAREAWRAGGFESLDAGR